MFLHIQDVLTADEVAFFRQKLWAADAPWVDGARSAGGQATHQKNNLQAAQAGGLSAQAQGLVKAALNRNALFFSAALPRPLQPAVQQVWRWRQLLWQPRGQRRHALARRQLLGARRPPCTLFLTPED